MNVSLLPRSSECLGTSVLTSGIPGRSREHVQGGALLDPLVAPPRPELGSPLRPTPPFACDYLPPELSIDFEH